MTVPDPDTVMDVLVVHGVDDPDEIADVLRRARVHARVVRPDRRPTQVRVRSADVPRIREILELQDRR